MISKLATGNSGLYFNRVEAGRIKGEDFWRLAYPGDPCYVISPRIFRTLGISNNQGPLTDYLRSLDKIYALHVDMLLAGHGKWTPFPVAQKCFATGAKPLPI